MKPAVALTVLSIATAIVAQLRFLPSEAGDGERFWPRSGQNAWASYADEGVMSIPHCAHDPSARFAGTSPSRDPRRGGMMNAQKGHGARDDGAAARSDALMGTPNKKTPVPQDNRFSTSPRLEQQLPATEPPAPRGATPAPVVTPR
jgi:hypothetical protein